MTGVNYKKIRHYAEKALNIKTRRDFEFEAALFKASNSVISNKSSLSADISVKAASVYQGDSDAKKRTVADTAGKSKYLNVDGVVFDPNRKKEEGSYLKLHVTERERKLALMSPDPQPNWGWIKDEERNANSLPRPTEAKLRVTRYPVDPKTGLPMKSNGIEIKELGRTLGEMNPGGKLMARAARAFGVVVDALGKFRCPPGTPAANQFTNARGENCFNFGIGDMANIANSLTNLMQPSNDRVAFLRAMLEAGVPAEELRRAYMAGGDGGLRSLAQALDLDNLLVGSKWDDASYRSSAVARLRDVMGMTEGAEERMRAFAEKKDLRIEELYFKYHWLWEDPDATEEEKLIKLLNAMKNDPDSPAFTGGELELLIGGSVESHRDAILKTALQAFDKNGRPVDGPHLDEIRRRMPGLSSASPDEIIQEYKNSKERGEDTFLTRFFDSMIERDRQFRVGAYKQLAYEASVNPQQYEGKNIRFLAHTFQEGGAAPDFSTSGMSGPKYIELYSASAIRGYRGEGAPPPGFYDVFSADGGTVDDQWRAIVSGTFDASEMAQWVTTYQTDIASELGNGWETFGAQVIAHETVHLNQYDAFIQYAKAQKAMGVTKYQVDIDALSNNEIWGLFEDFMENATPENLRDAFGADIEDIVDKRYDALAGAYSLTEQQKALQFAEAVERGTARLEDFKRARTIALLETQAEIGAAAKIGLIEPTPELNELLDRYMPARYVTTELPPRGATPDRPAVPVDAPRPVHREGEGSSVVDVVTTEVEVPTERGGGSRGGGRPDGMGRFEEENAPYWRDKATRLERRNSEMAARLRAGSVNEEHMDKLERDIFRLWSPGRSLGRAPHHEEAGNIRDEIIRESGLTTDELEDFVRRTRTVPPGRLTDSEREKILDASLLINQRRNELTERIRSLQSQAISARASGNEREAIRLQEEADNYKKIVNTSFFRDTGSKLNDLVDVLDHLPERGLSAPTDTGGGTRSLRSTSNPIPHTGVGFRDLGDMSDRQNQLLSEIDKDIIKKAVQTNDDESDKIWEMTDAGKLASTISDINSVNAAFSRNGLPAPIKDPDLDIEILSNFLQTMEKIPTEKDLVVEVDMDLDGGFDTGTVQPVSGIRTAKIIHDDIDGQGLRSSSSRASMAGRLLNSRKTAKLLKAMGIDEDNVEILQFTGELSAAFAIAGPPGVVAALVRRAGRDGADRALEIAVRNGWISPQTAEKITRVGLDKISRDGLPAGMAEALEELGKTAVNKVSKEKARFITEAAAEIGSSEFAAEIVLDETLSAIKEIDSNIPKGLRSSSTIAGEQRTSEILDEAKNLGINWRESGIQITPESREEIIKSASAYIRRLSETGSFTPIQSSPGFSKIVQDWARSADRGNISKLSERLMFFFNGEEGSKLAKIPMQDLRNGNYPFSVRIAIDREIALADGDMETVEKIDNFVRFMTDELPQMSDKQLSDLVRRSTVSFSENLSAPIMQTTDVKRIVSGKGGITVHDTEEMKKEGLMGTTHAFGSEGTADIRTGVEQVFGFPARGSKEGQREEIRRLRPASGHSVSFGVVRERQERIKRLYGEDFQSMYDFPIGSELSNQTDTELTYGPSHIILNDSVKPRTKIMSGDSAGGATRNAVNMDQVGEHAAQMGQIEGILYSAMTGRSFGSVAGASNPMYRYNQKYNETLVLGRFEPSEVRAVYADGLEQLRLEPGTTSRFNQQGPGNISLLMDAAKTRDKMLEEQGIELIFSPGFTEKNGRGFVSSHLSLKDDSLLGVDHVELFNPTMTRGWIKRNPDMFDGIPEDVLIPEDEPETTPYEALLRALIHRGGGPKRNFYFESRPGKSKEEEIGPDTDKTLLKEELARSISSRKKQKIEKSASSPSGLRSTTTRTDLSTISDSDRESLKQEGAVVRGMSKLERSQRWTAPNGDQYSIHMGSSELEGGVIDPSFSRGITSTEAGRSVAISGNTREMNVVGAKSKQSRLLSQIAQMQDQEDFYKEVSEGRINLETPLRGGYQRKPPGQGLSTHREEMLAGLGMYPYYKPWLEESGATIEIVDGQRILVLPPETASLQDESRTALARRHAAERRQYFQSEIQKDEKRLEVFRRLESEEYQHVSSYPASELNYEASYGYGGRYEGTDIRSTDSNSDVKKSDTIGIHIIRHTPDVDSFETGPGNEEIGLAGKRQPIATLVIPRSDLQREDARQIFDGWVDRSIMQDMSANTAQQQQETDLSGLRSTTAKTKFEDIAEPEIKKLTDESEQIKKMSEEDLTQEFTDGEYTYVVHFGAPVLEGGVLKPSLSRGKLTGGDSNFDQGNSRQLNRAYANQYKSKQRLLNQKQNAARNVVNDLKLNGQIEPSEKYEIGGLETFESMRQLIPYNKGGIGARRDPRFDKDWNRPWPDSDDLEALDKTVEELIEELETAYSEAKKEVERMSPIVQKLDENDNQFVSTYPLAPVVSGRLRGWGYGGRYGDKDKDRGFIDLEEIGSSSGTDRWTQGERTGVHIVRVKPGTDSAKLFREFNVPSITDSNDEVHIFGEHEPVASFDVPTVGISTEGTEKRKSSDVLQQIFPALMLRAVREDKERRKLQQKSPHVQISTKALPNVSPIGQSFSAKNTTPSRKKTKTSVRISIPKGSKAQITDGKQKADSLMMPPGKIKFTGVGEDGKPEAELVEQMSAAEYMKKIEQATLGTMGVEDLSVVQSAKKRLERVKKQRKSIALSSKNQSMSNMENMTLEKSGSIMSSVMQDSSDVLTNNKININEETISETEFIERYKQSVAGAVASLKRELKANVFANIEPDTRAFILSKSDSELRALVSTAAKIIHDGFDRRARMSMTKTSLSKFMENGRVLTASSDSQSINAVRQMSSFSEKLVAAGITTVEIMHRSIVEKLEQGLKTRGTRVGSEEYAEYGRGIELVLRAQVAPRIAYGRNASSAMIVLLEEDNYERIEAAIFGQIIESEKIAQDNILGILSAMKNGDISRLLINNGEPAFESFVIGDVSLNDIEHLKVPGSIVNVGEKPVADSDPIGGRSKISMILKGRGWSSQKIEEFFDKGGLIGGGYTPKYFSYVLQARAGAEVKQRIMEMGMPDVIITNRDGIDIFADETWFTPPPSKKRGLPALAEIARKEIEAIIDKIAPVKEAPAKKKVKS